MSEERSHLRVEVLGERRRTGHPYLFRPAGRSYLFLISFSKDVSLSYPNSPPAGRGMFMMSACVATRTTRSGFFSLPPNAKGESVAYESLASFLTGSPAPEECCVVCPQPQGQHYRLWLLVLILHQSSQKIPGWTTRQQMALRDFLR